MTRAERIQKLAKAIKDYRGRYKPDAKGNVVKWITAPQPHAMARVMKWLQELGLPQEESIKKIDGFKNYSEYEAWIKGL